LVLLWGDRVNGPALHRTNPMGEPLPLDTRRSFIDIRALRAVARSYLSAVVLFIARFSTILLMPPMQAGEKSYGRDGRHTTREAGGTKGGPEPRCSHADGESGCGVLCAAGLEPLCPRAGRLAPRNSGRGRGSTGRCNAPLPGSDPRVPPGSKSPPGPSRLLPLRSRAGQRFRGVRRPRGSSAEHLGVQVGQGDLRDRHPGRR
jgi:hypothetical protein